MKAVVVPLQPENEEREWIGDGGKIAARWGQIGQRPDIGSTPIVARKLKD